MGLLILELCVYALGSSSITLQMLRVILVHMFVERVSDRKSVWLQEICLAV